MDGVLATENMTSDANEIKGNGNIKGIKRSLSCSDDEDGFLGFDIGELYAKN